MTTRRVLFAVLGLAAALAARPGTLVAQAIQRSMYVSVLNDAGAPVPDLGPADFIIREDNATREVLSVRPATEPMQIAILVDTSEAARDDIQHMRLALPAFVSALTSGDVKNELAIIAVGERPTVFTEYTSNRAALQKGIDRIWSMQGSGAYLLEGLIEVARGLKKREAARPVIVSITTEGPELSNSQHDQVLEPIRDIGAAYHAITLGRPSSSLSDEIRNRNMVFDLGTRQTGGRREELLTSMALGQTLTQLATELKNQYRVTYSRPASLIPPEKITVAAAKPGLVARGTAVKEKPQGRP
jgi:hypothetical protein